MIAMRADRRSFLRACRAYFFAPGARACHQNCHNLRYFQPVAVHSRVARDEARPCAIDVTASPNELAQGSAASSSASGLS
jgi:hypothetical protein